MSFLSGTRGYVRVGAATYAFGKWRCSMKGGSPKVTNWTTLGYQALVGGVVSATLTISGAWDVGAMPLVVNTNYVFHLGLDSGVEIAVTAQVTALDPENDVEDTPRVTVTAESNGAFTAAIV